MFSVSIDTADRLVGSMEWVKRVKMVKRYKLLVTRKISSGDAMYSLVIKVDNVALYTRKLLSVYILKCFQHKKKKFVTV